MYGGVNVEMNCIRNSVFISGTLITINNDQ